MEDLEEAAQNVDFGTALSRIFWGQKGDLTRKGAPLRLARWSDPAIPLHPGSPSWPASGVPGQMTCSLLHSRESFNTGVAPSFRESFAFAHATAVIELEQLHCGLPHRVHRIDASAMQ